MITPITVLHPSLIAVKQALDFTHVNGGCCVMQYRIDAAPAVSWAMSRNRFGEFDWFDRLFKIETVQATLPEVVNANMNIASFEMDAIFVTYGRLAWLISRGGTYKRLSGTDEEALVLADDFARAAFGTRLSDTYAWVNWKPWTGWFADVAWDGTFFWFDTTTGIATVLMITDTD